MRVALIGIGSVRCGPPIIASLATFFGERELEIFLYDSDQQRLEVFDRFARLCFLMNESTHRVLSTDSPEEALDGAEFIVLSLSNNCATKLLKSRDLEPDGDPVSQAIDLMNLDSHPEASILSLQREPIPAESYYRLNWPNDLSSEERASMPIQLLRWLNEEEYPFELLSQNEKSPLKAWIENPTTAEYVRGR